MSTTDEDKQALKP